jgi:hypothetical protein
MKIKRLTESDLYRMIEARYMAPEWACFPQVPSATGAAHRRIADAVAMSLWPSRGLAVHGFEIKVNKRDLLNELANPSKAEGIGKFCDYWWLVVTSGLADGLVLPETWGLLEESSGKLVIKKQPEKMESQPLTRGFVASLLRRASVGKDALLKDMVPKSSIQDKLDREYERGVGSRSWARDNEISRLRHIETTMKKFQEGTGISFGDGWRMNGEMAAKAMRIGYALLGGFDDISSMIRSLDILMNDSTKMKEAFKKVLAGEKPGSAFICEDVDKTGSEG